MFNITFFKDAKGIFTHFIICNTIYNAFNKFISVITWGRVAPSTPAGGTCIKRMTKIIINN